MKTLDFKSDQRTGVWSFHKMTDARPSHYLPPRPFIGLDDDDDAAILRIAESWLAGHDGATLQ